MRITLKQLRTLVSIADERSSEGLQVHPQHKEHFGTLEVLELDGGLVGERRIVWPDGEMSGPLDTLGRPAKPVG